MEQPEPPKILQHDAWPGYRKKFYIVAAICIAYLIIVFLMGGEQIGHGEHH